MGKADLVRLAVDACQLEVGDSRAGRAVLDPQEGLDVEVQLLLQLLVLDHSLDVKARKYLCIHLVHSATGPLYVGKANGASRRYFSSDRETWKGEQFM